MTHSTITIGKSDSGAVTLDVSRLIVSRMLVTASSGGGKSWLLRKILEGVSSATQTIVIDTEGEFATLREKRDMVLAGPAGEVPADTRVASLLCRRLMELNLSAVVDVSELKPSDRRDFVSRFCRTLVDLPRALWRPCVIAIDETHEYAPEGDKCESADAIALLGSKGRKRGYCLLGATQRLSKLAKDVAAELKNQFIGQMTLDVDLKRAADVLGFGKDRWPELRDLSPPGREGEFFCFGPALNHRGVLKFRAGMVETTHPKAGQGRLAEPPAPSAKIRGVLGELKDLPKQAEDEAKDLASAKRKIVELERELKAKPSAVMPTAMATATADEKTVKRAVDSALADYSRQSAERDRGWQAAVKNLEKVVSDCRGRFAKIGQLCRVNGEAAVTVPAAIKLPTKTIPKTIPENPPKRVIGRDSPPRGVHEGQELPKGEAAVLSALIQFPDGLRREQLTVLTTYKRSTRDRYILYLREKGFVDVAGDVIAATDAGREALPDAQPLPTGPELRDFWIAKLPPGERAILEVLMEAYPDAVSRDTLSELTGQKRSTRDRYLLYMRNKQLIDEPSRGEVAASKELF